MHAYLQVMPNGKVPVAACMQVVVKRINNTVTDSEWQLLQTSP
jgi:hypothetical protein